MGFLIGSKSNKAKFLKAINLATGGGFTLAGNKLKQSAGYKPKLKSSAAFRKKIISHLKMSTTVTLHFSRGYNEYDKSGKSYPMPFEHPLEAKVGYSSKAGTDMHVVLWGGESLDKKVPKNKQQELLIARAALLIHEINVHVIPTIINDKRKSAAIMIETKKMLNDGVGIPAFFIPYWSKKLGIETHDSKINQTKGKSWITPMN